MSPPNRSEEHFLDALQSLFAGAPVEGKSGFINLMKIKSRVFREQVFPRLRQDIEVAVAPFAPSFRQELCDQLYTFFSSCISENGSIYFRPGTTVPHPPLHRNNYERVYTADREVMLWQQTHRLYYVKTDRPFHSAGGGDYFINKNARAFLREQFDMWLYQYLFEGPSPFTETRLSQLQVIQTIAGKIIYYLSQFEDELVRIWNKPKFVLNSHYLITLDKILLASSSPSPAGEGERAKGETLLEKIFTNPNISTQIAEWDDLGMLDDQTPRSARGLLEWITRKDLFGEPLHPQYRFLPLDTQYFADLELDLLALFDDLDAALDGWLIHSENYQALNTLLPKFRARIKTIYIDPPYNTGGDEFIYRDQFRHASWLTMMENRVTLARQWMREEDGAFFVSIDDHEHSALRTLMSHCLGENCFKNEIVVRRGIKNVQAQFETVDSLNKGHEYVLLFASSPKVRFPKTLVGKGREHGSWNNHWRGTNRPTMRYDLFGILPEKGQWRWSRERSLAAIDQYARMVRELGGDEDQITQDKIDQWYLENIESSGEEIDLLRLSPSGTPEHYVPPSKGSLLSDLWDDLQSSYTRELTTLFGEAIFGNPKALKLIERVISVNNSDDLLVLDFFAGSGTTAHAVMNSNRADGGRRKYILVEMGEHFNSVVLPRVKKAAFSNRWKDGKALSPLSGMSGRGLSHFVKYYELEQYEDTLRKVRYEDAPFFADTHNSYVFLRAMKSLAAVPVDKTTDKVAVRLERLYDGIDLAETLSCLTGKWIRRITKDTVEFQDGTSASLVEPDWEMVKPLVWWSP